MPIVPELAPLPSEGVEGPGRLGSVAAYFAAVGICVLAVLSQYFLPQLVPALRPVYGSLVGGLAIVYGIPIVAFLALVGTRPLGRWAAHPGVALWEGIRWYALLLLLGLFLIVAMIPFYERFDPGALNLLSRPNPVLAGAESDPLFWVAFSFAIGAVEETIFRGWIFGFWLAKGTDSWGWHAAWTSALFAAVHLYYGITYGAAAPLIYPTLFLMGFAFAATVRASGGNLWVAALLHGAHDSAAFLSIISPSGALAAEYGLILLGLLIAIVDVIATSAPGPEPSPFAWGPGPPTGARGWPPAYGDRAPPPWTPPPGPPPPPSNPPGPPPPG